MDIEQVRQVLDKMPTKSEYEFRHLEMEAQGSWHRQMRHALRQKETLHDERELVLAEMQLLGCKSKKLDKKVKDKAEREAKQRIIDIGINRLERKAQDLKNQMDQIDVWLDDHKFEECLDAASTFEQSEPEHWVEHLGREIGIELLVEKQASKESMMRAALLPLQDFKKSVLITNQFANFLRKTAETVEASLYPNKPVDLPAVDAVVETVTPASPTVDVPEETPAPTKAKRTKA